VNWEEVEMPIKAQVEYLANRVERPIYYASSAGRNATHEIDQPMNLASVDVDDARTVLDAGAGAEFGMHPCGFDLFDFPTRVRNFLDKEQVEAIYEAEIESFLKAVTGCYRVHIFDYTVRASDPGLRELKQVREPASLVHNDYTANSGFTCLRENLGDDAQALAQGRFQILNVWRPQVDPVEDYPLALCDARSVDPLDLIDSERRAPNHIGEIQLAVHAPEQHWYYYPQMRPPEVLLFKTFDSKDGGANPCSIHSAIQLPHVPADAKPRESIETRAFVFYR
jgi:hypothetical protein